MKFISFNLQPIGGCTNLLYICYKFFLPNEDWNECKRGDVMFVKPDNHNPRTYCNHKKPVYNYPAMSHIDHGTGNMKVWFKMIPGVFPDRKAQCTVYCNSGNYVPA